jgi:hypothetical protein
MVRLDVDNKAKWFNVSLGENARMVRMNNLNLLTIVMKER